MHKRELGLDTSATHVLISWQTRHAKIQSDWRSLLLIRFNLDMTIQESEVKEA